MGFHYQLVDANIQFLASERKFGLRVDEHGKKKRETAGRISEPRYRRSAEALFQLPACDAGPVPQGYLRYG